MNATGQIPIAANMRISDDPISPDRMKLSVTRWRASPEGESVAAGPACADYAAAPDATSDPADSEYRLLLTFADGFRVALPVNAQSGWMDEGTE